jgi:hypothetical protein
MIAERSAHGVAGCVERLGRRDHGLAPPYQSRPQFDFRQLQWLPFPSKAVISSISN